MTALTKTVYQTNYQGVFIGLAVADTSPLEPDVWLIPFGAVEVAPPEIPEGMQARWAVDRWVIEDIPPAVPEVPSTSTSLSAETGASLPRHLFVVALTTTNPPILSEDEALAALENFPPKFSAALAGKSLAYRALAVESWRTATSVSRNAPLFLDLLAYYAASQQLTDTEAEELGDFIFAGVQ